ncbi:hypothetical protein ABE10_02395, partial [Bacillus toyonensis]|nr:hypothetical protein [Bacillus toyonensis]
MMAGSHVPTGEWVPGRQGRRSAGVADPDLGAAVDALARFGIRAGGPDQAPGELRHARRRLEPGVAECLHRGGEVHAVHVGHLDRGGSERHDERDRVPWAPVPAALTFAGADHLALADVLAVFADDLGGDAELL